jgi:hypothetical protein
MVAELNGTSAAQQEIMQRSRNESDARTPRTPKAPRARREETFVRFCESSPQDESVSPRRPDFRSAHSLVASVRASSRRFW